MAEPSQTAADAPDDREHLRDGLLEQLAHLIREVEMLEGVIGRVPGRLLAEAPPGERFSIKETFALLALLDENVHGLRLERIAAEDAPRFEPPDAEALLAAEAWSERSMEAIFARVRRARQDLIDAFETIAPEDWLRIGRFPAEPISEENADAPKERDLKERDLKERDLYEMTHALCLHDTRRLRAMSRRLYESHLGPPPPPPKEEDGEHAGEDNPKGRAA